MGVRNFERCGGAMVDTAENAHPLAGLVFVAWPSTGSRAVT